MTFQNDEQKQAYIAALVEERQGAVVYGKKDRVEAIDAELARIGHEGSPKAARATKRAAKR